MLSIGSHLFDLSIILHLLIENQSILRNKFVFTIKLSLIDYLILLNLLAGDIE